MKKFSFIKKIGKSLVPSEFYVHILQEPLYSAFGYMALFVLMLSVIVGGYLGYQQKTAFDSILRDYREGSIPPFKISEEGLWIEGNDVIIIDYLDVPIIMDDDGILDINDIMSYESVLFFEKNRVVFASVNFDTIMYDYSEIKNILGLMMLNEFDSEKHLELFAAGSFLSIPVGMTLQFVTTAFSFLYYSVIVLMIANITRTILGLGLKLRQVYHMVIYAMTFSSFWTNFSMLLPRNVPLFLDTFVHFILPVLILLSVFMHIRKKAIEEIRKKHH